MNYTFPVNKQEILLNAGFSILWQSMDLEDDSKIIKDNQKSLTLLLAKIAKENNLVGSDFQKIASVFVAVGTPRTLQARLTPVDATKPSNTMPAPTVHKQKNSKETTSSYCIPYLKPRKQGQAGNSTETKDQLGAKLHRCQTEPIPSKYQLS